MNGVAEGLPPEAMLRDLYRAVIGSEDHEGLIHVARNNSEAISGLKETVYGHGEGRKGGLLYRVGQVEDVIVWFRRLWWILAVNSIVIAIGIPAWLWAVLRSSGG